MTQNEYVSEALRLIKQMSSAVKKEGKLDYLKLYEYYHDKHERKKFKAKRRRQLEAKLARKKKK